MVSPQSSLPVSDSQPAWAHAAAMCRRSTEEGAGPRGGDSPYVSAEGHALIDIKFCKCLRVPLQPRALRPLCADPGFASVLRPLLAAGCLLAACWLPCGLCKKEGSMRSSVCAGC